MIDDLKTVAEFANAHPTFSQGSLRWLIFNADTNGFSKVIRRVGGRVLLDELAFSEWIENQTSRS